MKTRKILLTVILSAVVGLIWVGGTQNQGIAQEGGITYVGSEICAGCHEDTARTWALTAHRQTLFNDQPSMNGCESCHGPGGEHVGAAGDKTKIVVPSDLEPSETAAICLKCHTQANVTLWGTSLHSRAKVSCTDCHNPHSPSTRMMSKAVDDGKIALEGLSRSISQAELSAGDAAQGSKEQATANEKVDQLKEERDELIENVKGAETAYRRSAVPYLCYTCHKDKQVQSQMPSHHPIQEGKVKCTDCHNPHGGPQRMLRAESINETCFRCHAEKLGPFTFEHPPVTEDCTICHAPHGSVNNNLLVQSEPFLCLKCHAGQHAGSRREDPATFATYYTNCLDCHTQIHGSDEHAPLHY